MAVVECSTKAGWLSFRALRKPFKKRVNRDNTEFRDKIAYVGVLPVVEDPDLSWSAAPALPQHLPPWVMVMQGGGGQARPNPPISGNSRFRTCTQGGHWDTLVQLGQSGRAREIFVIIFIDAIFLQFCIICQSIFRSSWILTRLFAFAHMNSIKFEICVFKISLS